MKVNDLMHLMVIAGSRQEDCCMLHWLLAYKQILEDKKVIQAP